MASGGLTAAEQVGIAKAIYGPFESGWPKRYRRALAKAAAPGRSPGLTGPPVRPAKVKAGKKARKQSKAEVTKVIGGQLEIVKSTPKLRVVRGLLTDESVDRDGERTDYEWAKREAQHWFQTGGNVRLMHTMTAVGKAVRVIPEDAGRRVLLEARIVDKAAIRLIDEGVVQGFSWGARSMPGNPVRVVKVGGDKWCCGGELVEVSLVDRPSNRNSAFNVVPQEVA